MAHLQPKLAELDPVWARIMHEAEQAVDDEPLLGGLAVAELAALVVGGDPDLGADASDHPIALRLGERR